jgi:hypothetical protein
VSYRSWPFHRDGGNLYYTYPGGNSTWYSAPYPWVVHLRAPTIRLYSPSPYYVTPWVSAPPSYFFNPSRTAFNIDWDSDAGKSWDVNLFRGWGKVSARGGDAKKDHSGGRHHSKVTVSYNASTPTYGNVYIHPNYGSVPYSLIPLIEGFRSTRHYPSTGNGAMLRYSSLINGGSRAYPRYSGYSGTGYVTRHPSGAYIIQSRR